MNTRDKLILLVDDDEDDRLFFQEALEDLENPVTLHTAEHGWDAIQLLEEHPNNKPDAIFIVINMPVMDGHECLKKIRANSQFDDIKIIMYSTSYNPEVAKVLESDGANHFIRKPSNYISLIDVIKTALSVITDGVPHTQFLIAI